MVDVGVLEGALGLVVERHEVLRTVFREGVGGVVEQVVLPGGGVSLPVVDVSGVGEGGVWSVVEEETGRGFDLSCGPLLRGRLLRCGVDEWVLVLCVHHIVVDGWSLGVLVEELGEAYGALSGGGVPGWGVLPVQYADFAVWQREWLSGGGVAGQVDFWRGRLAGAPALDVVGDRGRPVRSSFAGDSVPVRVSSGVVGRLGEVAEGESATLFMALLAGFCGVLHRFTGQGDVVVGTPVAGRTRTELEGLVGFFVNTLALRCGVSGESSFREVLREVRGVALDAFAHQDVPFERIVQE
ncbi:non-ribosomal peptide synthetase, partial [Streptomyces triticagri]